MLNKKNLHIKRVLFGAVAFLLLSILVVSCAKDDISPTPTTTPAAQANFSWTADGAATTADSAICYLQLTTIYAYKNGTSQTIELNLSDVTTGNYPVNAASGNEIKYVNASVTKAVSSGSVSLTNTGGSKLSGSFAGNFAGGTGSISGQFSNVSFR